MRADKKPDYVDYAFNSYFARKIKQNTQHSVKKINQTSQQ